MQQFAAALRARIVQARLELETARHDADADGVALHERRIRYLTGAAIEYGVAVGLPAMRHAVRLAAREPKE